MKKRMSKLASAALAAIMAFSLCTTALAAAASSTPLGLKDLPETGLVPTESIEVGGLTVSYLGDQVWHIEDCNAANPHGYHYNENGVRVGINNCTDIYIVLGETKAMMVDASNPHPGEHDNLLRIFDELSEGREQLVWLTHYHGDHTGMVPAFDRRDTPIYITKEDHVNLSKELQERTTPFDVNDEIDLGGRVFKCVLTPGHSEGSNVLYETATHIAFSGDSVGSGNSVYCIDIPAYEASVHRLLDVIDTELGGEVTIYSGHTWQGDMPIGLGWRPDRPEPVVLDRQYVADMCTILENVRSGGEYGISQRPYNAGFDLDVYVSYGKALISVSRHALAAWTLENNGQPLRVFNDVEGDLLIEAVCRLYARNVINGTGLLTFEPGRALTRAELIAVLANVANADVSTATASFSDVPADAWYAGSAAWARQKGLVTTSTFSGGGVVTQAEANRIVDRFNDACGTEIDPILNPSGNMTRGDLALLLLPWARATSTAPITLQSVYLPAGELVGFKEDGVYNFKGIPYATAQRFQSPVPVTEYPDGKKMALSFGAVSPQGGTLAHSSVNGVELLTPSNGTADMVANETCQFLNVWTDNLYSKKPVVVFFHGGGLVSGASSELSTYTGKYFADVEDAVFVSVNHRLNILGFLDLSEYGSQYANSAVAGLEDCVMALQWVHDNIAQFGGDPNNVTIVGQSGGGQKVNALACMPETVGLFDKVVCMSGSYDLGSASTSRARTQQLVESMGLSREEVIPTLTSMSYDELYEAYTKAGWGASATYGNDLLPAPLFDENGKLNQYAAQRQWMIGTVYGDHSGSNGPSLQRGVTDPSRYLPGISDEEAMERLTERHGDNAQRLAELYRETYPGHQLAEALFINTTTRNGRGRLIRNDGTSLLQQFSDNGVDVYNYVVAYRMPLLGGVTMCHTADMGFWFYTLDEVDYMVKGDEVNAYRVSRQMADALASFAADGNPSTPSLRWTPYRHSAHDTMVFDVNSACKTAYDEEFQNLLLDTLAQ